MSTAVKCSLMGLLLVGLLLGGCGDVTKEASKTTTMKAGSDAPEKKGEEKSPEEPAGEAPAPEKPAAPASAGETLDLSAVEIPGVLEVPKGAVAKSTSWGDVTVELGTTFNITVAEGAADLADRKKEIEANTVNKLKAFHVETEDTLLYSSEVMGKEEFHFLTNVKLGEAVYSFENTKGPAYTREQAETMLKAARSLRAK
jgi:hypothetical protein